jgi:hypothetical protein
VVLEFEKVVPQVERMGRALAALNVDMSERAIEAWDRFLALDDLDAVHDRIQLARQRDVPGGAPQQPINVAYPLPPLPERAAIPAADTRFTPAPTARRCIT